ncbi:MAG: imidazole glycerol phosphate synthase subunit HisH [Candidatus Gracilibacteria bacterium]|jgi:glutamine amidotransferase
MIAIIDYGAGNLQSVANALKKLGEPFEVVRKPAELSKAQKVIFPGQGAAGSAMQVLLESGFIEAIPKLTMPFLGICLGMQLLANFSEEDNTQCLGIIPGRVKKMKISLKVPHVGWNKVAINQRSPLVEGLNNNSYFYFVHSYYFDAPQENIFGQTLYEIDFPSIVQKENFYGVQFHPEKSGEAGFQLLRNFCKKC